MTNRETLACILPWMRSSSQARSLSASRRKKGDADGATAITRSTARRAQFLWRVSQRTSAA
jgi:hypothetical protein